MLNNVSSSTKNVCLFLLIYIVCNYALSGFSLELKIILALVLNLVMMFFTYTGSLIFLENMELFQKNESNKTLVRLITSMALLLVSVYLYLVISTVEFEINRETVKTLMLIGEQMVSVFFLCKYRKEIWK